MKPRILLVTGAIGYIGERLVPCLIDNGYTVRCLVRDPQRLATCSWSDQVEMVQGDVLKPDSLPDVLDGIDVAYYLIHSLSAGKDEFAERDRRATPNRR